MGQGLGKNSPVQLTLGRENYEALLDRHGQWIRWRTADKCACVNKQTFQPDLHCKKCGGRGYVYSYQPKQITQCIVMARDTSGILELSSEFENDTLIKVYDRSGTEYNNADKNGSFIVLNAGTIVKGVYFNILMERDNLSIRESALLSKDNDGEYYIIPGIEVSKEKIDGVYYKAPCDVVSVDYVKDANGEQFTVSEYRLNKVLLKEKQDEEGAAITPVEPLTAYNIKYIKPYTFALLNQNLNKADSEMMVEASGDAICTYPYSCDVAEGDVLTVLAGTITQKDIIARTSDTIDKLPAFFVESITKIIDSDGIEYTNGVDFILSGTNSIKWLIEDGPEAGEGYSVTYKVYPTYCVVKNIPQLRSSENQRFPKKAIVKFMASYSEQRKINRQ